MQIRIEGVAEFISDKDEIASYWHRIQQASRKDYTTNLAPGTAIKNPDNVVYKSEDNHFCAVKIKPTKIEYLRLKRPNHLRILFSKRDADWSSEFLVP